MLLKEQYADIVENPYGGKRVEDFKVFIKIKDEFAFYREDGASSGVSFSMFVERVLLEIPSLKSKEQVLVSSIPLNNDFNSIFLTLEKALYQWASRNISYNQHKESLLRTSLKNLHEFIQETLDAVAHELKMHTEAQDRDKQERARLSRVECSHADLEEWRERKRKEMEQAQHDKTRQMAEQVAKDLARQRKEEERRDEIREMIEARRKEEEARAARAKEMEILIKEKEEEERKALAKVIFMIHENYLP